MAQPTGGYDQASRTQETAMSRRKSIASSELVQIALILVLMTVFRSSFADHYHVPTGSMEYTVMPGDRVLVDKSAYGVRIPLTTFDLFGASTPDRGDIVVFDSPRDGVRLIKRIVAVGGDSVSLSDGRLSVNGVRLAEEARFSDDARLVEAASEDYAGRYALLNLADGGGPDLVDLAIPAGMVLVLGDHRGNSLDGRYFGLIPEEEILGRALGIYYRRGDGLTWRKL
jgi:signal peptidase I